MPTVELIESPWNDDGQVFAGVTLRGVSAGKRGFTGFNFADHVGDKADCNQLKQQLMKSNIWAGDDNSKNWKSEFKGKFDEKNDPNCRGVMDDKLKADLRASHYQIGENGNFFLFKKQKMLRNTVNITVNFIKIDMKLLKKRTNVQLSLLLGSVIKPAIIGQFTELILILKKMTIKVNF